MDILIGLIPALAWGLLPIAATKMGGKPSNQILGTTAGTLLVAIIVFLVLKPEISLQTVVLSALSGAFWVVGQIGQYTAYTRIGVSRTLPISTGLQLVGTSLIGVFVFGEWSSGFAGLDAAQARLIGFAALAVLVLGVYLTAVQRGGSSQGVDARTLLLLFVTNFGYLAYSTIPDIVRAKGTAIFLPQAVGMAAAALLYVVASGQRRAFFQLESRKNILTGFLFAVAALTYILSAQRNGVATGFVLSQLNVVIATLAGILVLKEQKTPFEMKATLAGLLLIVAAASVTAFL